MPHVSLAIALRKPRDALIDKREKAVRHPAATLFAAGLGLGSMLLALAMPAQGQSGSIVPSEGWASDPPVLDSMVEFARGESDLRVAVRSYVEDREGLKRRYPVRFSPTRIARLRQFQEGWKDRLAEVDFEGLNHEGQIDYILLRNRIDFALKMLDLDQRRAEEMAPLLPFADRIRRLEENRLDRKRPEPREAAATIDAVAKTASALTASLKEDAAESPDGLAHREGISKVVGMRAANQVEHFKDILAEFNGFYDGYDPDYTFWAREAHERASAALKDYATALRRYIAGIEPGEAPIQAGEPVHAEGLRAHLAVEMIPYTPQELIEIGRQEFNHVIKLMKSVSKDMGYGDNWKAALEDTKELAPPPGEAPWAIFDIVKYEMEYIESLGTITLPPLSREIWRLTMSSPELQLRNPFFRGGEETSLSYPEISMEFDDKLMSMRGNTPHFNFPTVQHELIPGHHLQSFMFRRFNAHRQMLNRTPFNIEGWAFYWELKLWDDSKFPRNNPDRMGMLFWRLHRAARIIFSLNYQLGNWSPQQAVDFLVEEVGFEPANAEAEIRRTTMAPPLYQISYMIGALQLRALHKELVDSGKITEKEFHNGYLLAGPMPIELLRARLSEAPLTPDYGRNWRYYEEISRD